MAAVVAGVMLVVLDLLSLLVFGFGQRVGEGFVSLGLLIRSTIAPVAGALLLLGLVGLYARQSEATGVPGLISFLVAFVGTVLAQSFILADLLANLGWALFGVSCLRARVYPRVASTLLTIGAVGTGVASALPRGEPGSVLMYAVGSHGIFFSPRSPSLSSSASWRLGACIHLRATRTLPGLQRAI